MHTQNDCQYLKKTFTIHIHAIYIYAISSQIFRLNFSNRNDDAISLTRSTILFVKFFAFSINWQIGEHLIQLFALWNTWRTIFKLPDSVSISVKCAWKSERKIVIKWADWLKSRLIWWFYFTIFRFVDIQLSCYSLLIIVDAFQWNSLILLKQNVKYFRSVQKKED